MKGNEKKTLFSFYISSDLLKKVKKRAKRDDRSFAYVINKAVEKFFERKKENE